MVERAPLHHGDPGLITEAKNPLILPPCIEQGAKKILYNQRIFASPTANLPGLQEQPSAHSGSGALYFIDGHRVGDELGGDHLLYLAFLEEGAETSTHFHKGTDEKKPIIEQWLWLDGKGAVLLGGMQAPLDKNNPFAEAKDGVVHQMLADKDSSLWVVIITLNAGSVPPGELHKPAE